MSAQAAHATTLFQVTNLVSDGFVPAPTIDPNLINPWGVAFGPHTPFWVANNNSGTATIYNSGGAKLPLTVTIAAPGGSTGPATPTGTVFNGDSSAFRLTSNPNSSALFLWATEDGTISGWSPNVSLTSSVLQVDNSQGGAGAVYKGLALADNSGQETLYATNFRAGDVEMYNSNFQLTGTFTDPTVAAGFAPFNVADFGGNLYVSFAKQNAEKHDDVAGPGNGYIDEFSLSGVFEKRLVSMGGMVNSPWGLDIAPASFGTFAGDLLVGNFGDGTISAFNPANGDFVGTLDGKDGKPLVVGDLWSLVTGNGALAGSANSVYFTAGVLKESHGLFGSITAIPEPATWLVMILGAGLIGGEMRRKRASLGSGLA